MTTENNKDLAVKAFDALNKQDPAGLAAVFSPKWAAEFTRMLPGVYALWSGHHIELTDLIAEDDKVWCRLRTSGTHAGEWMGIPPTGRQWTNTGTWFFRVSDGRIVEVEWKMDELNLLRQLGATISPPPKPAA